MDASLSQGLVDSRLVGPQRPATLQHQGDAFEGKTSFRRSDIQLDLNIHSVLPISCGRDVSGPIRMPTAISIAKIARTIMMTSSVAMSLLLNGHLTRTCLSRLRRRTACCWPSQDYLFGAAASRRGCTLLPSSRLTGGLRIT